MKKDFLIADTKHGKRLCMVEPDQMQGMVDAGKAKHVRGNMYKTKVMQADVQAEMHPVRADARESCAGQKLEAEEQQQPAKRGRGRPPGKKDKRK